MATRSLNVVISGDAKQLGVATRQAEGHMDGLAAKGANVGKKLAVGFGAAGAAAGGALVIGLKKSVDAAKEAEKSQARLEAQMKASGASYRAHGKDIDAVIQKHSKLAGVDDEDLQDAFTGILRSTGSVSKAMKDMGLVTDLMRGKNIDAAKAGDLLSKVHNGNVGALKRMGIAIDPVTKAQDKLKDSNKKATDEQVKAAKAADKTATAQAGIAALQKRFGGQAEAYGKTAAGAQERFGVAVENLQEKIGAKLLPVVASVTNKVADFVGGMESGKGAGGRFADAIKDGFGKAKDAVQSAITAIRGWLNRNRDDIDSVISAFRKVAGIAKDVFMGTMLPIIKRTIKSIGDQIDGLVHVVRGIVRTISGLLSGDWEKAWDGAKEVIRGAFKIIKASITNNIDNILEIVKDLGPKIVKGIAKGLFNMDKAILTGIMKGIEAAAKALPGVAGSALKGIGKGITSGISKGFGALNPFGDGIGMPAGGGAGLAGGSLMGAKSIMSPFVSMAGRFGLHTSSGLRPGAITSSGNPSFHGSGNAVDEAGSPSGMLGYFRYLKAKFGSVLRELIYTPGGVGIKNGRPFQYTGQVAADHFDHVHVAFTGGAGDGIGEIKNLWVREGGNPAAANMAAAISMAESGGNPQASNRNSDGSIDRGLWQINSVHGAMSTFDRKANADAAISISSNGRNWNPWTVFKTGAYKRFLSAAGKTKADGGSGGSSAKGPKQIKGGFASGGGIGKYDPAAIYGDDNASDPLSDAPDVNAFVKAQQGKALSRPLKGGGPTKGHTQEEQDALTAAREAAEAAAANTPTLEDYANARVARARLTSGTEDDLGALGNLLQVKQAQMDAALADSDPRNDQSAIDAFLSVKDSIDQLKSATDQNTKALQDTMDSLTAELQKNREIAEDVRSTSEFQLTKTLADLISGHIVGRGVVGRAFTPGSGVSYAY